MITADILKFIHDETNLSSDFLQEYTEWYFGVGQHVEPHTLPVSALGKALAPPASLGMDSQLEGESQLSLLAEPPAAFVNSSASVNDAAKIVRARQQLKAGLQLARGSEDKSKASWRKSLERKATGVKNPNLELKALWDNPQKRPDLIQAFMESKGDVQATLEIIHQRSHVKRRTKRRENEYYTAKDLLTLVFKGDEAKCSAHIEDCKRRKVVEKNAMDENLDEYPVAGRLKVIVTCICMYMYMYMYTYMYTYRYPYTHMCKYVSTVMLMVVVLCT